jgi:hypothetical protein
VKLILTNVAHSRVLTEQLAETLSTRSHASVLWVSVAFDVKSMTTIVQPGSWIPYTIDWSSHFRDREILAIQMNLAIL